MAVTMSLWEIADGTKPKPLAKTNLRLEERLEDWIDVDPDILGIDALIIGRQVRTSYGGVIDLLAVNEAGEVIIIELKRDKTPRDIVAQALDYASWVVELGRDDLERICHEHRGKGLAAVYSDHYDQHEPDAFNSAHQILIVAASVDDATERIVDYLSEHHRLNINVIFFNIFEHGGKELIGRSWLADPDIVEVRSANRVKGPWSGYYYVNTGVAEKDEWEDKGARKWEQLVKFGYISAGGGPRWIKAIKRLRAGDRIFAYINGVGYVGYGVVEAEALPIRDFMAEDKPVLSLLGANHPWQKNRDDDSKTEYLAARDRRSRHHRG